MTETNQPYKIYLDNLIRANGRTRKWISEQLGVTRVCFWQNVNKDTFTEADKIKIKRIIVEGKVDEA